jgi:dTDP-glucose pyrophosphorylase
MIGIIPAGGKATRIHGIPKYLLPTPRGTLIDVLIRRMQLAAPREIVVMTKGFNATLLKHVDLTDVTICDHDDKSMAHAVMLAGEYAQRDEIALFGMPDTYFEDGQAFRKIASVFEHNFKIDVIAGVFRARPEQRHKLGMCRIEAWRHIVEVVDKPEKTDLEYAWGILAWRSAFWSCMRQDDPHVGYALPRAITRGLDVRAMIFQGNYYDCGTPAEYFECVKSFEAVADGA